MIIASAGAAAGSVVIFVIAIIVIVVAVRSYRGSERADRHGVRYSKQGQAVAFLSSATMDEVILQVSGIVNSRKDWHTTSISENSATFECVTKPSGCLAILLLWLFVVPGIVYLVNGGKMESLTLHVSEEGSLQRVQVSTSGIQGNEALHSIQRSLASFPASG